MNDVIKMNGIEVGDEVKIDCWKKGMIVQSVSGDGRYYIATMKAFGKTLYSIIDKVDMIAGASNQVFSSFDYSTREQCDSAMRLLESGEMRIGRNQVDFVNLVISYKGKSK